jgi:hypothetical protein
MNDGSNNFWNAGFGGGNTNMGQQDEFAGHDNGYGDHNEAEYNGDEHAVERAVNKPKMGHAFEAPLTAEEELRVQQIEAEQQERLRNLKAIEENEYSEKKGKQQEGRDELDSWYTTKNQERQSKSKQNKEEEWALLQTRDEHKKSKNPWEKIVDNVEINANKYIGGKDVSRMRQAMLARKGDLKDERR